MVNSRTYIAPGNRTTYRPFLCRFYGAKEQKSRPLPLIVRCDDESHYPLVETVLDDMAIQPYVHDCSVMVLHNNRWLYYRVFYRRHCRLLINHSVCLVARSSWVRGDIVVMRTDWKGHALGMHHGDAVTADEIVVEFSRRMNPRRNKKTAPKKMLVVNLACQSLRQWRLYMFAKRRAA
ncbi:hypothetical protein BV20DRAFT_947960 [Pilatotrama ljubarskyi]|nr:hypothetical protein BV20DRAFT_947960 [Pilatotrama ljubarskyi]